MWAKLFFGAGFLVLFAGCRRTEPPLASDPLEVTFAGCSSVMRTDAGTRCEIGDPASLRLAIDPRATDLFVREDDTAPRALSRGDPGAPSLVEISKSAVRLTVTARVAGAPARFELNLARAESMAWLEDAKAKRASGDLAAARTVVEPHLKAPSDRERALATSMAARISLAEGRADEAFPLFEQAIALHRRERRISDAADDSFALAFALHQRSHRYEDARAVLDALAADLPYYPEGRAREPYYRGVLAGEVGDHRGALTLLRLSEERAHALGMKTLERNAREALGVEMQALGRPRASLEVFRALEREADLTECDRVRLANNVGWAALLANEAEGTAALDARGPLLQAAGNAACADAYLTSFALGNLARLSLDQGNVDDAEARLAEARKLVSVPRGTERLAWMDLDARILLARKKRAEALRRFDEARALAQSAALPFAEWSALVGRGEALEALGKQDAAIASFLEAEDVVSRTLTLVPLGGGRGSFVADRSKSARAAIDLLLAAGRTREAVGVAMRSRTRVIQTVERPERLDRLTEDERKAWERAVRAYRSAREHLDHEAENDWKLPANELARITATRSKAERDQRDALERAMPNRIRTEDALPATPSSSDLEIVIHPGRASWWAFAVDAEKTTALRVPSSDAPVADLARALLDPISARIERVRRVRIRPYGAWRNVDVHALPFHDASLVDAVAVDYPLGIGAPLTSARSRRALVVGNPTGDLPRAADEAARTATALGPRFEIRRLTGAEATTARTLGALRDADFFHYAGHGRFSGDEGWESSLPLAQGGHLSIADIVALAAAPRVVVLTGCETARTSGEAEGLGIGQAFILAGADVVVAPTRPVSDEVGAAFAKGLYEGSVDEPWTDAARRSAMNLRKSGAGDWSAFRVLAR